MSATTVSGSAPASDDGLLRNTFHVVPPPPPRQKVWSELAIAIGLALFINLIVILSFILRAPIAMPPADPPAISVDLVQEPPPQPQPQPREQKSQAKEDIPGWAQTILPGFDVRSGKPDASSREQQAARSSGGANEFFNRTRDAILANVKQTETGGFQGLAEFEVIIHRSGKIVSLRLMRSSGYKTLDQAFANAIVRTQPYKYPAGISADFLPIIVELKSRSIGD